MDDSEWGFCAYCGMRRRVEREHVVPLALFPPSVRSKASFVIVDACRPCNKSFSDDEDDLRNFCSMAGKDIPEAKELFEKKVMKSLKRKPYGRGPLERIWQKMKLDPELNRYRISPDEGTFRALRKIVRGLAYHHFEDVTGDDRVDVKICPYIIPPGFDETDSGMYVLHSAVFRYWMVPNLPDDGHSFWFLSILRTRNFVAIVHR